MLRHLIVTSALLALSSHARCQELEFNVLAGRTNSIHEVIDAIRTVRENGVTTAAIVTLSEGTHRIEKPIVLNETVVGNGLTIQSGKGQAATISGSIMLTASSNSSETEVRYSLPEEFQQATWPRVILVNGKLSTAARFPRTGFLRIKNALPDRRSGFISNEADITFDLQPERHRTDLILLHDWSSSRMPVDSFDVTTRALRTRGPIGAVANHYAIDHFEKQPRYWLEGHPDFATEPTDWFIDHETNQLVVIHNSKEETPALTVELPVLEQLLVATADSSAIQNLKLKQLTFTGTKFPMPEGGLAGSQATMHERRSPDGQRKGNRRDILTAAVYIEHATNCEVSQCRFRDLGNTGLWLAGRTSHCRATECVVVNVGGNGINLGEDRTRRINKQSWDLAAPDQVAKGNRVERCKISFCGRLLPGSVAVWASLHEDLIIANNTITDCPYTGISLGWIWNDSKSPARNNKVVNNRISLVMQTLSDGAGIYTLGKQPESVLSGNIITDVPLNAGRAESNAIFCDEGTTGFVIENNTMRRLARSPVRFHQAGENIVRENRWELGGSTPAVRFNATPEGRIQITGNSTLEPQSSILVIGNSLTWDTRPGLLDGNVHWHVDCGKPLTFIRDNPESPCVDSSRIWPIALATTEYDFISVQPHNGTSLGEDFEVISNWVQLQPQATFVIHTGWARSATLAEERSDDDPSGPLTHSDVYFEALIQKLRSRHPKTTFRCTNAMNALFEISDDIADGQSPFQAVSELYRDAIHMKTESGRYLMHNAMRIALNQPVSAEGFPELPDDVKRYLDGKIHSLAAKQP